MKKMITTILSLLFMPCCIGAGAFGHAEFKTDLEGASLLSCFSAPLLVTGQTTYYHHADDGDLQKGKAFSYSDNGNGTITDNVTGLMWAQDGDGKGCCWGQQTDWYSAIDYCDSIEFAGFDDWRLPNIRELQSLANYGLYYPAIDSTNFPNTKTMYYWSSTTSSYSSNHAWVIYFRNGGVHVNDSFLEKSDSANLYVRAVRGEPDGLLVTGQTVSYRTGDDGYYQKGVTFDYTDNGDGTISDNATGLMWAKDGDGDGCGGGSTKTWDDALDWADGLLFAGHEDWRLPNARELLSLTDYSRQIPAVNPLYFPNTKAEADDNYWSSTTSYSSTTKAWEITYRFGILRPYSPKTYSRYVRVVRDLPCGPTPIPSATPPPSTTPTPYIPSPTPTITPQGFHTPIPTATPPATRTPTPPPTPPSPGGIIDSGDYDGNGTSDIAIFRPASGLWAVRGITRVYFGSASDIPVCGDFDGDGTTDISLFRAGTGLWAIRNLTRAYFGSADDYAIPGDYDGNGCCDMGIFRDASGLWAILGLTRIYFGSGNDQAVPGDYDGDGTKDPAVFRPGSGLWALRNISRIYFGGSADGTVPGDYSGDGTWEVGIFRPASSLWAVRNLTRTYFGSAADRARQADYDGDGSADAAVFRDNTGLWAIKCITRVYYGSTGDFPVTR